MKLILKIKKLNKELSKKLIKDLISQLLKNILFQIGQGINMLQLINVLEAHAKSEYQVLKEVLKIQEFEMSIFQN